VQAIKNGAFDYIVKGDDNNKIIPLINRAIEKSSLTLRVVELEDKLAKKYSFDTVIGTSKTISDAIELAKKVSVTDTTVLLTGETGTGKEVFANAIHQNSPRKTRNFIALNCSAFSHDLLESELFGHVAGAFTGAIKDKKGLFEEAHKGTIFLDEIGEMPLDLQAKLLRVLENGEYLKVGESKVAHADVRIIAATNRDLLKEIEAGRFRQDLYYRLSIFSIKLPSLRERVTDIEELAKKFLAAFALKTNKKISALSPGFLQLLKLHNWPGNIRELKNVLERSVILETGTTLSEETLPLEIRQLQTEPIETGAPKMLSAFSLAAAEKIHIQKVINHTGGNKTETARLLNIALTTLYRKLDEYKIQ